MKSPFAQVTLHALYRLALSYTTRGPGVYGASTNAYRVCLVVMRLLPSQLQGILQASVQAAEDPCVSAQRGQGIPHAMLHLPVHCKNSFELLSYVL